MPWKMRVLIQTLERTASTSMQRYLCEIMEKPINRAHWGMPSREGRGSGFLPPRARGDELTEGFPTHIVTIVRDPYERMISLMRKTRSTLFDYTAHEDYHKVLKKWADVYSEPFCEPFTVIGKLGILKFEMIDDAVPMMLEWLGISTDIQFPHHAATNAGKPKIEMASLDEEKIKAMYDGKYAKHFGYHA